MNLDKIGMVASASCVVHCTLLPFVMIAIPTFSVSLFASEEIEWAFLGISFILNLISLCFGFKKHKSYKAFSFSGIGFGLIVICNMIKVHYSRHDHFEFDLYNVILILGGLSITLSHYINNILCKKCKTCKTEGCHH
jgi:hypothetical protein